MNRFGHSVAFEMKDALGRQHVYVQAGPTGGDDSGSFLLPYGNEKEQKFAEELIALINRSPEINQPPWYENKQPVEKKPVEDNGETSPWDNEEFLKEMSGDIYPETED